MMHVHATELGAAMKLRKHFARIHQRSRIKRTLHMLLLFQIRFIEHHRHQVALLDTDTMLACQHAADLDAQAKNVSPELLCTLKLPRLVGIVKHQRMKIAIAGVKDIRDAKLVMH